MAAEERPCGSVRASLTIATDLTLYDGLRLLERNAARQIVVVNDEGEIVGNVTRASVNHWGGSRRRERGVGVSGQLLQHT